MAHSLVPGLQRDSVTSVQSTCSRHSTHWWSETAQCGVSVSSSQCALCGAAHALVCDGVADASGRSARRAGRALHALFGGGVALGPAVGARGIVQAFDTDAFRLTLWNAADGLSPAAIFGLRAAQRAVVRREIADLRARAIRVPQALDAFILRCVGLRLLAEGAIGAGAVAIVVAFDAAIDLGVADTAGAGAPICRALAMRIVQGIRRSLSMPDRSKAGRNGSRPASARRCWYSCRAPHPHHHRLSGCIGRPGAGEPLGHIQLPSSSLRGPVFPHAAVRKAPDAVARVEARGHPASPQVRVFLQSSASELHCVLARAASSASPSVQSEERCIYLQASRQNRAPRPTDTPFGPTESDGESPVVAVSGSTALSSSASHKA